MARVVGQNVVGGLASALFFCGKKKLFRLWSRHQTQISQKQHNIYTKAT
jgi:hypothetical protein